MIIARYIDIWLVVTTCYIDCYCEGIVMDNKELKDYLLSYFHDSKYQSHSLIDIFLKDEKHYTHGQGW